jgi:hypothetical protein
MTEGLIKKIVVPALLTVFSVVHLSAQDLPIRAGPFLPTESSLIQYHCPDWFRDAKFGIWAHWGPQSVPRHGDWYARELYEEGGDDYKDHLARYGHPSKNGYKTSSLWKAEKWNPEKLMALYKKTGARYFVSMGSHHDNFFYGILKSTGGMRSKWVLTKTLLASGKRRQKIRGCILVFPNTSQPVTPGFKWRINRIQPERLKEFRMTEMIRNTRTCITPKQAQAIPYGLQSTGTGCMNGTKM